MTNHKFSVALLSTLLTALAIMTTLPQNAAALAPCTTDVVVLNLTTPAGLDFAQCGKCSAVKVGQRLQIVVPECPSTGYVY